MVMKTEQKMTEPLLTIADDLDAKTQEQIKSGPPYQCPGCGKKLKSRSGFETHVAKTCPAKKAEDGETEIPPDPEAEARAERRREAVRRSSGTVVSALLVGITARVWQYATGEQLQIPGPSPDIFGDDPEKPVPFMEKHAHACTEALADLARDWEPPAWLPLLFCHAELVLINAQHVEAKKEKPDAETIPSGWISTPEGKFPPSDFGKPIE